MKFKFIQKFNLLKSKMAEIKVRDIMKKEFKTIEKDASLNEAIIKMTKENIGALVVQPTEKKEPFGIITRKDIIYAYASGKDLNTTKVGEISKSPLAIVSPGMPIFYAAKMMKNLNVKHLAVFNGMEIVGILSNVDIIFALAKQATEQKTK